MLDPDFLTNDPPGESKSMRPRSQSLFQQHSPPPARDRTLRIFAGACTWISESFLGFALVLLSKTREFENTGGSMQREEGVLLPGLNCGDGDKMRDEIILWECPGCKRKVDFLIPLHDSQRCEDCLSVLNERKKQFDKAGLN